MYVGSHLYAMSHRYRRTIYTLTFTVFRVIYTVVTSTESTIQTIIENITIIVGCLLLMSNEEVCHSMKDMKLFSSV